MTAGAAADRSFMEQTLALATLGEGTTSPNPRVGCLVVREGVVVGRGVHHAAGQPHAEAQAVQQAGDRAKGATLYVNLEPCVHYGRTPPCADEIVRAGVRRVVASIIDPNPLVDGKGFARLRGAGLAVDVGLLAASATSVNAAFLHWHRTGRPLVTLKAAISMDGALAARGGRSRWITGTAARRFAHRLRFSHDAVLVGAGTIRQDDPQLTVRLPGVGATRLRAVLSPTLDLSPAARVFEADGSPVVLYVSNDLADGATAPFARRAEVVRVQTAAGSLDLGAVLDDLGRRGAQSVLVEGGGRTLGAFLDAGMAQRAFLFVSPRLLGARGATAFLDVDTASDPGTGWRLEAVRRIALGEDWVVIGNLACGPGRSEA